MGRLVVFTLEGALCGLPVESVREVVRAAWPTPLPGTPSWVLGCVEVGGVIRPVIDARALLGRGRPGVRASDAWMLVEFDPASMGPAFLAVDAVLDLIDAPEPSVSTLPFPPGEARDPCYVGVASTGIGLVCVPAADRLFDPRARELLREALARGAGPELPAEVAE